MKKLPVVAGALILVVVGWFVVAAMKPPLLATVDLTRHSLIITNDNKTVWRAPTIRLAGDNDAPTLVVPGEWKPGEKQEIELSRFERTVSREAFKPDVEQTQEVVIEVAGFKLGIYK